MDSGNIRVYSISVLSASGCFSPVDRVRSWIRKRFGMLFEKNGLSSDCYKEDRQTYFLRLLSIVTSRSWDGSMLKSRTAKSNVSIH